MNIYTKKTVRELRILAPADSGGIISSMDGRELQVGTCLTPRGVIPLPCIVDGNRVIVLSPGNADMLMRGLRAVCVDSVMTTMPEHLKNARL
jgi:hypothetical protein